MARESQGSFLRIILGLRAEKIRSVDRACGGGAVRTQAEVGDVEGPLTLQTVVCLLSSLSVMV